MRQQLEQAGIQNSEKLLAIQKEFGGRIIRNGLEVARFGIIHEHAYWFENGKICVEDDEESLSIRLKCADTNPQDDLLIDEDGVMYTLYGPLNESPDMFFLQEDYLEGLRWDWRKATEIQRKTINEMADISFLPHVSDRYTRLYEDDNYIYSFNQDGEGQDVWRKFSAEHDQQELSANIKKPSLIESLLDWLRSIT
ncbi:hypothetical protein [Vacuolonema iberomarrocanum]|uniref:hypothetical protein n=1 Tax=Vacuolonema iberomarrocanum TaxID=3454632 RepID=UPI003F6DB8B9